MYDLLALDTEDRLQRRQLARAVHWRGVEWHRNFSGPDIILPPS